MGFSPGWLPALLLPHLPRHWGPQPGNSWPAGRTAEGGDLPSLTQASSSHLSLLLIPLRKACLWLQRNLLPGKAMSRRSSWGIPPRKRKEEPDSRYRPQLLLPASQRLMSARQAPLGVPVSVLSRASPWVFHGWTCSPAGTPSLHLPVCTVNILSAMSPPAYPTKRHQGCRGSRPMPSS